MYPTRVVTHPSNKNFFYNFLPHGIRSTSICMLVSCHRWTLEPFFCFFLSKTQPWRRKKNRKVECEALVQIDPPNRAKLKFIRRNQIRQRLAIKISFMLISLSAVRDTCKVAWNYNSGHQTCLISDEKAFLCSPRFKRVYANARRKNLKLANFASRCACEIAEFLLGSRGLVVNKNNNSDPKTLE